MYRILCCKQSYFTGRMPSVSQYRQAIKEELKTMMHATTENESLSFHSFLIAGIWPIILNAENAYVF